MSRPAQSILALQISQVRWMAIAQNPSTRLLVAANYFSPPPAEPIPNSASMDSLASRS